MFTLLPISRWRNALLCSGAQGPKPAVRATLLTLAVRADKNELTFFMTVAELAEWMGVTKRTAERHLAEALESGWLEQVRRGRTGRATDYRLLIGDTPNPDGRIPNPTELTASPNPTDLAGSNPTDLTGSNPTELSAQQGLNMEINRNIDLDQKTEKDCKESDLQSFHGDFVAADGRETVGLTDTNFVHVVPPRWARQYRTDCIVAASEFRGERYPADEWAVYVGAFLMNRHPDDSRIADEIEAA
ncbi:helix-turn-helix domain-containing protein [Tsukamurella paurometabola]|uniref:Helix-turn-helix domain-containing protein n=1 Tax=Tsukamurella paurometabola TaxID=2061 RepID=A0ABS5NJV8_TSUPA|nr:helix-turn-helix domain-containing protein [Tsukamurella paurometabola]MBS4104305.1 helix-turn-helix domain-containing protein [Tsukamurella paurometabola]